MSYNLETAASSSKSSLAASSSESSLHRLPVKYNLALLLEQLDLNYSKQQVLEGTNKMLANTRWERLNVLTKRAHLNQWKQNFFHVRNARVIWKVVTKKEIRISPLVFKKKLKNQLFLHVTLKERHGPLFFLNKAQVEMVLAKEIKILFKL